MERKNLLQLTKDILELMESDLVSTINETQESQMVHREIRNTYMELMSRPGWDHLKRLRNLDNIPSSADTSLVAYGGYPTIVGTQVTVGVFDAVRVRTASTNYSSRGWARVVLTTKPGSGIWSFVFGPSRTISTNNFTYMEISSANTIRVSDGKGNFHTVVTGATFASGNEFVLYWDVTAGSYGIIDHTGTVHDNLQNFVPLNTGHVSYLNLHAGATGANMVLNVHSTGQAGSYSPTGYAPWGLSRYPSYLMIPNDIAEISNFKYDITGSDNRLKMKELQYLPPEQFLTNQQTLNTSLPNVVTIKDMYDEIEIPVKTDSHPTYWTSFDNKHIICDSFLASDDPYGLDQDKTQVMATVTPKWIESDTFIPDMPPQLFPMLLYEAAEACMELHDKEESQTISRRALRGRSLFKKMDLRHNGKSKKGFGRR